MLLVGDSDSGGYVSQAFGSLNAMSGHALEEASPSNLDFVMVNPPFYSDEAQAAEARDDGRLRTTFTSGESICSGGEVGFVERMIRDSVEGR